MNAKLIIKTMTGQLYRQTNDQTNQEIMNITVVFNTILCTFCVKNPIFNAHIYICVHWQINNNYTNAAKPKKPRKHCKI